MAVIGTRVLRLHFCLSISVSYLIVMVVLQRIDWLLSQIHNGASASVHVSFNADLSRTKVSFRLLGKGYNTFSPMITDMIYMVRQHELSHVARVWDGGHRHSDGVQQVTFWVAHAVSGVFSGAEDAEGSGGEGREAADCAGHNLRQGGGSEGFEGPAGLQGSHTEQFDIKEFRPELYRFTVSRHGSEDSEESRASDGFRDSEEGQGCERSPGADGFQGFERCQASVRLQGFDSSRTLHFEGSVDITGYPQLTDPEAQKQDDILQREQRGRTEALEELAALGLSDDSCAVMLREALQEIHEQRVALRCAGQYRPPNKQKAVTRQIMPLRSCLKKRWPLCMRSSLSSSAGRR
eukprot:TRINITY_DN11471_c0_g2_i2.p1 TRINITY_DN11471_c0_g2~~TRINITY_DN11471_c0_g2_i2.p1  ORF type:complete len:357 (+),score=39.31 TRINITY_DN11471_c0_g2_i2:22-1071(+)